MDNLLTKVIQFNAGFATDLAPQVRQLTFLDKAENIIYEVDGAVRKVGGAAKINSSVLSGAPSITGMFDYWTTGSSGADTQKFVVVTSDSKVYKEDMDGTFDDITGAVAITAGAIPTFAVLNDLLTIFFSTNDAPVSWDQTGNVAALAGTPPSGRGAVTHVNRLWVWGTQANPSRINYSTAGSPIDWVTESGSIDIARNDGDRIIGCVSHKGTLFIFKGPNKGSIHTLNGNTVATFSLAPLVKGIALQSPNDIVDVGDDVWFKSDRGIHSLTATQNYGNFTQAFLSRFLRSYFRGSMNRTTFASGWGVDYAEKGCVLWTHTASGASTNNTALGFSYVRAQEEGTKPFLWTGRTCISAAIRIHPTTKLREVVFGGNDGFVRRQDVSDRNIDTSTAYSMRVRTPKIIVAEADPRGKPVGDQPVEIVDVALKSKSVGDYDVSVSLTRDYQTPQTLTFNQGSAGFILGSATAGVLGTSKLGGGDLQIVYANVGGEARSIRLDITQGGLNQDANIYEALIRYKPTSHSKATNL